jgi:NAD(P)-dependent dehydrogenase (short-subunit alcohol dehydrogenase family)
MQGKIAIITGASSGIGLETAIALMESPEYIRVVLGVRSIAKMQSALDNRPLSASAVKKYDIRQVDLVSLASVEGFARYCSSLPRIDRLVLNAGINGYTDESHKITVDGMDEIWQVDFFANVHLVRLLSPLLTRTESSRVVCLSSVMHWFGNPRGIADLSLKGQLGTCKARSKYSTYADTKMAITIYSAELNRRGVVESVAVNPGGVASDIFRAWFAIPFIGTIIRMIFSLILLSCSDGAKTTIYACEGSRDGPGAGFQYLSPYGQIKGCGKLVRCITDMFGFHVARNPSDFVAECSEEALDIQNGALLWKTAMDILERARPNSGNTS